VRAQPQLNELRQSTLLPASATLVGVCRVAVLLSGHRCFPQLRLPAACFLCSALFGRTPLLRRVRLETPLGHGNFLSGLKLVGERGGGLGLARFSAVCPWGGRMYANGLYGTQIWQVLHVWA
jgi:hypothetical protein